MICAFAISAVWLCLADSGDTSKLVPIPRPKPIEILMLAAADMQIQKGRFGPESTDPFWWPKQLTFNPDIRDDSASIVELATGQVYPEVQRISKGNPISTEYDIHMITEQQSTLLENHRKQTLKEYINEITGEERKQIYDQLPERCTPEEIKKHFMQYLTHQYCTQPLP